MLLTVIIIVPILSCPGSLPTVSSTRKSVFMTPKHHWKEEVGHGLNKMKHLKHNICNNITQFQDNLLPNFATATSWKK